MNDSNKKTGIKDCQARVMDSANDLVNESKKYANELYQQGMDKVSGAEDVVKQYSDRAAQKIQDKPFTSILVAAGVGMLLSVLFRK